MGITEDLKYPFNEEGWYKTIGIGMVFEYFTWLVLPALFLAGYYIRVMRHTAAGREEPPEFHSYKELTVDGVKAFVILGLYFFVPVVVAWIFFIPALLALLNGEPGALAGMVLGMGVSTVVLLVFAYGGVAGLVKYSHTNSITSAFSPSLLKIITTGAWVKAWIKVLVTGVLSFLASVLIGVVPFVNFAHIVLIPFQVKYFVTVYARIFSRAYAAAAGTRESFDLDEVESPTTANAAGNGSGGSATATSRTPSGQSGTPRSQTGGSPADANLEWEEQGGPTGATLQVKNPTEHVREAVVACLTPDETVFKETVTLDPGEQRRWDDLPDEQFQIGVLLDGDRAQEAFDPDTGLVTVLLTPIGAAFETGSSTATTGTETAETTGTTATEAAATETPATDPASTETPATDPASTETPATDPASTATTATEQQAGTGSSAPSQKSSGSHPGSPSDRSQAPPDAGTTRDRDPPTGKKPRTSTLLLLLLAVVTPAVFGLLQLLPLAPSIFAPEFLIVSTIYTLFSHWVSVVIVYGTMTNQLNASFFPVSPYAILFTNLLVYLGLIVDASSISRRTEWRPRLRYYLPGVFVLWFVTIPVYLYRRYKVSRRYSG